MVKRLAASLQEFRTAIGGGSMDSVDDPQFSAETADE